MFFIEPEIAILWVGVNNAWNRSEVSDRRDGFGIWLEGVATYSRLFRLVRVRMHDRNLEAMWRDSGDTARLLPHDAEVRHPDQAPPGYQIGFGGRRENLRSDPQSVVKDRRMVTQLARDLRWIVELSRRAGVRMIFITYPLAIPGSPFVPANIAIREVSDEYRIERLESVNSLAQIPREEREFLWALHPNGRLYREIAWDLAEMIVSD